MNIDWNLIEFGNPWVIYLLPLPILIWLIIPPAQQKRSALKVPFFDKAVNASGLQPKNGASFSPRKWYQSLVLCLVWILVLTGIAKPQIVGKPELEIKTARNFLLAVDLSGSMATRDWVIDGEKTSRWEAVKEVMHDFVDKRAGDRIGLVFFGSQAYLQAPFTTDLQMVGNMMDEVEVGLAGNKTALGNALGMGIQLFERDTIQKKVMLLLTDGVDSGSELKPIQAARLAANDSIIIHTIGIGTNNNGVYNLDDKTLRAIAETTGGRYFNAANSEELAQVYETLNEMEPIEFEATGFTPVTMLYYYPITLAGLLTILLHFVMSIGAIFRKDQAE